MKKIVYSDKSHSSSMVSGTEMSPRPHLEKVSRSPRPAGHHQASTGEVTSTPDSMKDRSRKDKQRVQGKFGVESRLQSYEHSEVKPAVEKARRDVEHDKYVNLHGSKRHEK